jgi:hypothetical protein
VFKPSASDQPKYADEAQSGVCQGQIRRSRLTSGDLSLSSLRVEADNGGLLKIHVLVAFGWSLDPEVGQAAAAARQQVTTSRRILAARKTAFVTAMTTP